MIPLFEAAARLSSAAIGLRKRREKAALARKHQKKVAAFFRRQKALTLDALGRQEYLFHESYRRLSEETTELTAAQWQRIWEEIARQSTPDLQEAIAAAEADGLIYGAEQLKRSLPFDAKTTFNLANPRAVAWFQQNGGSIEKIAGIQRTTGDQIKTIITKAIDEGWSYNQTAKEISEKFDGFSRDRAQLIAVNETAQAYEEGNMLFAQSLKDDGITMVKKWMNSGDDKVSDGCLENTADGFIPIDQYHSSVHQQPPRFPGCRCWEIYEQAPAG
jgi:hypothetical protein